LEEGKNIVLVSEAGTPGVADPGGRIIEELLKKDSEVLIVPIPGPSALISAISISGLKSLEFVFLGFVPKTKRNKFYEKINNFEGLSVFYESPFRIRKTLKEISEKVKGKEKIVICRELTKMFEEVIRLDFKDLGEKSQEINQKGEFTILIN
jgi:16S rRNA (cytidine1402-2'-O)-methyltransferase